MTVTTYYKVIYKTLHSPTTTIRRLMKLSHMLVESWQSIDLRFPVDDACIIVTIKGCPKTFQTHPVGLQIWYSSDVMLHIQFVLSLNQFFYPLHCLATTAFRAVLKDYTGNLNTVCHGCVLRVWMWWWHQSASTVKKKETYNKPFIK